MMSALRELIGKAKDAEEAKKKAKDLRVGRKHFEEALQKIKPISGQELKMYERFSQQFSDSAKPRVQPMKQVA
jgi:transitional endoplasmic reticulum ATPase